MHMQFWYEFASPYSYLAALRLEKLGQNPKYAALLGKMQWQAFFLGSIFAAQGIKNSPFKLNPSKGALYV